MTWFPFEQSAIRAEVYATSQIIAIFVGIEGMIAYLL